MAVTVGRTLLKQFLEARKAVLTQAAAAQQIGISPGQLVYYLQGTQRPKQAVAERIERWSGGEVPADSWLTDDEKAKLAAVERAPEPTGDKPAAPESDVKTPPASPVAKGKSEPPGPPADAFDDESTTTREVRPLPAVSVTERDRKDTQDDDRGDVLPPSQVEAHPELSGSPQRVTVLDDDRTPTPSPR